MKKILFILLFFNSYSIIAQDESGKDSTAFLDSVFNEMDEILDEMVKPKSFLSINAGIGTGFFNFKSSSSTSFHTQKKILFSPGINYYHKSGLGLSTTGYAIDDEKSMNFYQFSVTPSYDYIKRGKFSTGLAYTRYFTKDDLSFYTTPVRNEAYAYFNYRKPWLQPGIALGYGWGSRTTYEKQRVEILRLRRLRSRQETIQKEESVRDFSALFSIRHDFTWSGSLLKKDLLTLTPVLLLSTGTQNFGFNNSFQTNSKLLNNILPNNQNISDKRAFDTQSATFVLRGDYSIEKFFLQTQVLLDYYLHTTDNRLNNAFAIIAGVNF